MKITIELNKDTNQVTPVADEPITLPVLTNMCMTTVYAAMSSILSDTPKEEQEDMKTYLFDVFNESASTLLARFAPDIPLRPDITEEAILRHELEIADEKRNPS